MKFHLVLVLMLHLLAMAMGSSVSAEVFTRSFHIEHVVDLSSQFEFESFPVEIQEGPVRIGKFFFKNNGGDGFAITLASKNGSQLLPEDISDGAEGIPYTLELIPMSINLDDAVLHILNPNLTVSNYPVELVSMIGNPTEASDGLYVMVLSIDSDNYGKLNLAGNYRDLLKITYRDI